MRDPSWVRVGGPLCRYAGGFREEFEGQGYSPSTVVLHLQLMGHLSGWLAGEGFSCAALTDRGAGGPLPGWTAQRGLGLSSHQTVVAAAAGVSGWVGCVVWVGGV